MDTFELKKEQLKLAQKISLQDGFGRIKTVGGAEAIGIPKKLIASVVVCSYPELKPLEQKTYVLPEPLPYHPGFEAYSEMPALIEACNLLEQEPDVLLVKGTGILHPRKLGLASHLGLALNKPTVGVTDKLPFGKVENGRVIVAGEILGFEVRTREYSKPIYVSPGHLISLGSALKLVKDTLVYPHKMPEPLHLAHKVGKKRSEA